MGTLNCKEYYCPDSISRGIGQEYVIWDMIKSGLVSYLDLPKYDLEPSQN